MSDWLKALLGVEDQEIPADAVTSFEFANVPRGAAALLLVLVALGLVAGAFWVYRREGSAPARAKAALALLRSLVFACALVLVLEPVLTVDRIENVDKSTLLVLDDSLSMSTKDRYLDPVAHASVSNAIAQRREPRELSRAELVDLALRTSGLVDLLARQNHVLVFRFSDGVAPLATVPRAREGAAPAALPPLEPRPSAGTNLALALRGAVEEVGSDRVAAIVLVTDGRSNLGPPAEDVALFLRNKDLRLFAVAVGESLPPRNLRAVALAGPDRAFRNDPVVFEAQVEGKGFEGATVVFERRYPEASDEFERIGAEPVAFLEGGSTSSLKFSDRPPLTGTVEYRIRMDEEPEELTHKDNAKSHVARVVEEKARVLLVSGGPAHEYYAVKNVLLRDGTIQLACFLQSADPEFTQDGNDVPLVELPAQEKDLFGFDVVILHDPDGTRFPPDWPALLKRFVAEHRGGLCFVAGDKHTLPLVRSRSGEGENDLAGLLPVVLDLDRADMPGIGIGYGAYHRTPWRMVPDAAAMTHPATRFHSDPKRARDLVWDRLPPFYWFFPALKPKPGAVVLARHDDPREAVEPYGARPILAVHRYGGGQVMFLAADETHRWRGPAENVFDRFWVQTVRFLLEGRHAGEKRRFRVYLDREVVDLGDAVQVSAEVFDESFKPFEAPSVEVVVKGPDGKEETLALAAAEGKEGHFTGSFAAPAMGEYELRPAAKEFLPKEGPAAPSAAFTVILPDREMGDVRADRALLRDLAARTRGGFAELHELARLGDPAMIPPASERVVTQGRPVPLWDTWTTIAVLLGLLCAEWILRKKFRMV